MKVGNEVNINCNHCGKLDKKHINRIDAVVDNRKIIIVFIISGIVTVILWQLYGGISTITGIIPILMWMQEGKSTSDFNSYKIRRR